MWFNNALIYQYDMKEDVDLKDFLLEHSLKPCPPHARSIYGWTFVFESEILHEVTGSALICMGKEERILPRAVIQQFVKEKVGLLEKEQNRKIRQSEKAQMAEDLEFELLPKSFCVQKKMHALLDKRNKQLIINTSSSNQALQLINLLRQSIPDLSIEPIAINEHLALRIAEWIHSPETLPPEFQLASDCLLFSLNDENKRVTCKGYDLPAQEILNLLSQGMATAEISLIWKERIHLTLTHDFKFKKLKSLEYLCDDVNEIKKIDEIYQQQDAALLLLAGELHDLIKDLLAALSPILEIEEVITEAEIC